MKDISLQCVSQLRIVLPGDPLRPQPLKVTAHDMIRNNFRVVLQLEPGFNAGVYQRQRVDIAERHDAEEHEVAERYVLVIAVEVAKVTVDSGECFVELSSARV